MILVKFQGVDRDEHWVNVKKIIYFSSLDHDQTIIHFATGFIRVQGTPEETLGKIHAALREEVA